MIIKVFLLSATVAFVFYNSGYALISAVFMLFPCYRYTLEKKLRKRKEELLRQFRTGLDFLMTAVSAGSSVEAAFQETYENLKNIFDKKEMIVEEYALICKGLRMNQPVEGLVRSFAQRCGIREIKSFSDIFSISKRTGGDLPKIMGETGQIISERIMSKEEMLSMVEGKRMEASIMKLMPMAVILYFRITSDYMNCFYGNVAGITAMTTLLLIYGLCIMWIDRIIGGIG